jgi:hypothetical protein
MMNSMTGVPSMEQMFDLVPGQQISSAKIPSRLVLLFIVTAPYTIVKSSLPAGNWRAVQTFLLLGCCNPMWFTSVVAIVILHRKIVSRKSKKETRH